MLACRFIAIWFSNSDNINGECSFTHCFNNILTGSALITHKVLKFNGSCWNCSENTWTKCCAHRSQLQMKVFAQSFHGKSSF